MKQTSSRTVVLHACAANTRIAHTPTFKLRTDSLGARNRDVAASKKRCQGLQHLCSSRVLAELQSRYKRAVEQHAKAKLADDPLPIAKHFNGWMLFFGSSHLQDPSISMKIAGVAWHRLSPAKRREFNEEAACQREDEQEHRLQT